MSQTFEQPRFSPIDMAADLRRAKGVGAVAASKNGNPSVDEVEPNKSQEVSGPFEGKVIEEDGTKYRFEKVPTGRRVWDSSTQQLVPEYHSLKTYFSHHTVDIGPGPGWDGRFGLLDLGPEEMTEQYGHIFTRKEVSSPMGQRDEITDELVGGMPSDVPYYQLVRLQDVALSDATHEEAK